MGERLEHVRQIYNDTFNEFSFSLTQEKCFHDYKCFFGDMNFRIDLPTSEVRDLIRHGNLNRLLAFD